MHLIANPYCPAATLQGYSRTHNLYNEKLVKAALDHRCWESGAGKDGDVVIGEFLADLSVYNIVSMMVSSRRPAYREKV